MDNLIIIKRLEQSIGFVFLFVIITSYFCLQPCKFFIELYCRVFDTTEYSPMLIASLLTLIYALLINVIKKRIYKNLE